MLTRRLILTLSAAPVLATAACDQGAAPEGTVPVAVKHSAPAVSVAAVAVPAAKPPSISPEPVAKPASAREAPSIGALKQDTYILAEPSPGSPEIGALDIGGTARLKKTKPVGKNGCPGGWYAVEPAGYICHEHTTLEPDKHPLVRAKREHSIRLDSDAPYQWGESRYAPLYRTLPDAQEQRRWEAGLDKHIERLEELREARRAGASEAEVPHAPLAWEAWTSFPLEEPLPAFSMEARPLPGPWFTLQGMVARGTRWCLLDPHDRMDGRVLC